MAIMDKKGYGKAVRNRFQGKMSATEQGMGSPKLMADNVAGLEEYGPGDEVEIKVNAKLTDGGLEIISAECVGGSGEEEMAEEKGGDKEEEQMA